MSHENNRRWSKGDAGSANDVPGQAPGKRGHTDQLSSPRGKAARSGSVRDSELMGTSWLKGVLGFGTSGRAVVGEADPEKDKEKDKAKDKGKEKEKQKDEAEEGEEEGLVGSLETWGEST